jgi:hypothetical protein
MHKCVAVVVRVDIWVVAGGDFTPLAHQGSILQARPDSTLLHLVFAPQVRLGSVLPVPPGLDLPVDLSASGPVAFDQVAFDPWEVPVSAHLDPALPVCGHFHPPEGHLWG